MKLLQRLHLHKKIIIFLIVCLSFLNVNDVFAANTHSIDLELDSSQYLSITDANQTGLDIIGDISVEAWLKPESLPANSIFISKYLSTGNQRSYYANLTSDGKILFGISEDGTATDLADRKTDAIAAEIGTWVHFAATMDVSAGAAGIIIYINGSSVASTPVSANNAVAIFNGTAEFIIGAHSGPAYFFDGLMDEVRVWNDIRTATEISDNYQKELVGNETNLIGYWKLNNNALDETANNNDLTNNNSAVFSTDVPFVGDTPSLISIQSDLIIFE